MTDLKVGFVGCGLIANSHARGLAADPRATIVAVHDTDPERARRFADQHCPAGETAVVADTQAVIEACDALYVCTWTSAHLEPVLAAARTGRAVFCEKPLATDLAGAEALTAAVTEAGVVNQVGLVLRHSPAFRVLRHLINRPEVGPIMNVVFRDDQYLPTKGLYGSTWRADVARAGGGTVLEHSIHDLDLLTWLLGPIESVSARMGSVNGLAGIEDQATVVLVAASGAQAALVSVWHDVTSRPSQRQVEVFAQGGYASLEGDWNGPVAWDRTRGFDDSAGVAAVGDGRADLEATIGELRGDALAGVANDLDGRDQRPDVDFVTAVLENRPADPSFADALVAHRLADAAYRSAANDGSFLPLTRDPAAGTGDG